MIRSLALFWGFPNQLSSDSWVVGFEEADHAALWIARRPMGSDQRSSARARRSCGRQYQGEELYVRAEEGQRRRFSELLAQALPDPRLHIMMSMRSDFLGHLQNDKPLFKVRQHIDVPPLG